MAVSLVAQAQLEFFSPILDEKETKRNSRMKYLITVLVTVLILAGCTCDDPATCDTDLSVQKPPPIQEEVQWEWNGRDFVQVQP